MAINPHDDYEALAKLLYPSIEASGNVYYGQTRKLTIDETLGKNDLGFESHVEPIRVSDDNADYGYHYDNYLCWSIGSLKGSFKVDEFSDVLYAKYKLIITDKEVSNSLHSGSYNTYEKNVDLRLEELTTSDDLVDIFSDGRNFYIDHVGNDVYLYIVALPRPVQDTYSDSNALRLTAVNDSVTISLYYHPNLDSLSFKPIYQYKKNGASEWVPIIDWQNTNIELNAGEYIQVKLSNGFIDFGKYKYMRFVFEGIGGIKASGDIRSMLGTSDKQMYSYCYYRMFKDCTKLLYAPQLPAKTLTDYCYSGMFFGCSSLVTSPNLPATRLAEHCYQGMFMGCSSLVNAPNLPANKLESSCYASMFKNCSSLMKASVINANTSSESSDGYFYEMFYGCSSLTKAPRIRLDSIPYYSCGGMFSGCTNLSEVCIDATSKGDHAFYSWLYNVSSSGTFYCKPSANIFDVNSSSGIPTGWTRKSVDEYNEESQENSSYTSQEDIRGDEYRRGVMITSGYNSSDNGRGDITSSDTVGNMEQSFDENKTHQMGTYNSDGSLNQEIWGYKSFNSPVQFRNGIYCEGASLITLPPKHTYYPEVIINGTSHDQPGWYLLAEVDTKYMSSFTTDKVISTDSSGNDLPISAVSVSVTKTGNLSDYLHPTDAQVVNGDSTIHETTASMYSFADRDDIPDGLMLSGETTLSGNGGAFVTTRSAKIYDCTIVSSGNTDERVTFNKKYISSVEIGASNDIYLECKGDILLSSSSITTDGNIAPSDSNTYDIGNIDKQYNKIYGNLYGDFRHPVISDENNYPTYAYYETDYSGSVILLAFIELTIIYDDHDDFEGYTPDLDEQVADKLTSIPCTNAGTEFEILSVESDAAKINNKVIGSSQDDGVFTITDNNGDTHIPNECHIECYNIQSSYNGTVCSFASTDKLINKISKFVILNNINFSISSGYSSDYNAVIVECKGMSLIQTIK